MKKRELFFYESIREAIRTAMLEDKGVICFGLGTTDPKGIFGTTQGLEKEFGNLRVFDTPVSENCLTGVAIGLGISGFKPILSHQRLDFALLSMDQIVNNAAKWKFMFGRKNDVSITIRMIVGRGWGQGPTHSQNLHALFCHIPGLKVLCPSFPNDAAKMLLSAISDDSPTVFIEHRWLHGQKGKVNIPVKKTIIKPQRISSGDDITVVSSSYATVEALNAINLLRKEKVTIDLIDLKILKPLNFKLILSSIKKTKRLLVLDTGHYTGSIAHNIVSHVVCNQTDILKSPPKVLAIPDFPEPTSSSLLKNYHVNAINISKTCLKMMGKKVPSGLDTRKMQIDTPGDWFKGPF